MREAISRRARRGRPSGRRRRCGSPLLSSSTSLDTTLPLHTTRSTSLMTM